MAELFRLVKYFNLPRNISSWYPPKKSIEVHKDDMLWLPKREVAATVNPGWLILGDDPTWKKQGMKK